MGAGSNYPVIDYPGVCGGFACGTEANGINNLGEVVGDYTDSGGFTHGYFSIPGSNPVTFDVPGGVLTIANAVNNKGVIVGIYVDNANVVHGFIYNNGSLAFRDCPGARSTFLNGINDNGDIVGYCSGFGGFEIPAATGQFTSIPCNFPSLRPSGINKAGQIVGSYLSNNVFHGFYFSVSNCTTIDPFGSILTGINAINANGQFVGNYEDPGGHTHGFVAYGPQLVDPVPLPKAPAGP